LTFFLYVPTISVSSFLPQLQYRSVISLMQLCEWNRLKIHFILLYSTRVIHWRDCLFLN
jgi:hypothetical protein